MESLYTATEHFRCFGDVGNIPVDRVEKSLTDRTENIQDTLNGQSSVPDFLRCTSRGKEADSRLGQRGCKIDETCFVVHRQQRYVIWVFGMSIDNKREKILPMGGDIVTIRGKIEMR